MNAFAAEAVELNETDGLSYLCIRLAFKRGRKYCKSLREKLKSVHVKDIEAIH